LSTLSFQQSYWTISYQVIKETSISQKGVGCAEERDKSEVKVAVETYGHINNAGYKGMATTVTAAHHSVYLEAPE